MGGGFGKGIHNILEPIAFGVPVCFGPQHKKFREAQIFMDQKFGFEIRKAEDLIKIALNAKKPDGKMKGRLTFSNSFKIKKVQQKE